MKDIDKMQSSYDLQNPWYACAQEPIDAQLLQTTALIFSSMWAAQKVTSESQIHRLMLSCTRAARDLMTTIRMDEADRDGTLLPNIRPEMPDDLDPNFAPM